jgi:hypothetical protein
MSLTLIKRDGRHLRKQESIISVGLFVELLHNDVYLSRTYFSLQTVGLFAQFSKHVQLHKMKRKFVFSSSSSSKVCPLYSGFPSPKTKFRHLSLSLVSSSVGPWFVMLRRTPTMHLSLGLPLLRVPSGSHSKIFGGSLFPGILFTCPNHRSRFSSITSKMFFRTSMISLTVTFRSFSFLDFYQISSKNPSQLPVICSPVVCLVSMFVPHIVKYFGLKPGT